MGEAEVQLKAVKVAPSLLAADFSRLGEEVREMERAGADLLHLDIMDGRFVPNISFGMGVVKDVRRCTSLPLDAHLMIVEPERYVGEFVRAGADIITVHGEGCLHLHRLLQVIREMGVRAGVAVNPGTPLQAVEPVVHLVDLLLIMSVNPGFGGQDFIAGMEQKVKEARRLLDQAGSPAELQVDGGINASNAPGLVAAGATVLVAGSYIFGVRERAERMAALRSAGQ